MRRLVCAVVVALALSTVGGPPTARAASPSAAAVPGLVGISHTVADDARGRLYVSQGQYADGILALDLTGAVVDAVTGLGQVYGMTLSHDGQTLYAVSADGVVHAIDADTLEVAQTFDDCESVCGFELTEAGGLIWYSNGWYDEGTIGALDPSDGTVTPHVLDTESWIPLFSTPARPNEIYGWSFSGYRDGHYQSIIRFQVGTEPAPTLTELAVRDRDWSDLWYTELEFSPDGGSVMAAGWDNTQLFDAGTLAVRTTAPVDDAVDLAMSPSGLAASAGSGDVQVFRLDNNKMINEYYTGPVVKHGLTFVGDHLFVFSQGESFSDPPLLRVIVPTERTKISITLGARYGVAGQGIPVTVRGPAGRIVQFDAYTKKVRKNVLRRTIPANGVLVTRVPMDNSGCISATSLAAPGFDASESVDKCLGVQVGFKNSMRGSRGKKDGVYLFRTGDSAVMQSRTIPGDKSGKCVYFTAQIRRGAKWFAFAGTGCVRLDGHSTARASLSGKGLAGKTVRLRTRYLKDNVNLAGLSGWTTIRFVA